LLINKAFDKIINKKANDGQKESCSE